jgi:hypothetical protein
MKTSGFGLLMALGCSACGRGNAGGAQREIAPVKWELDIRKKKKTQKLLESLPESERPPQG